jgi:single stranded DNA-binding protein
MCADAELRTTQGDISVTSFCIANDTGYGDKKKANFIECVAWRKTAETVCKWFPKGTQIIVEGSIQTRSYTDKEGNKRKAFEVVASNVHFQSTKDSHNSKIMLQVVITEILWRLTPKKICLSKIAKNLIGRLLCRPLL